MLCDLSGTEKTSFIAFIFALGQVLLGLFFVLR
jgi:hypothetical protein